MWWWTEDGTVITADFWGNGIQTWTAAGAPVVQIELVTPPAPGFAQAFGVATAPNGDVYVMDRLNQRLSASTPPAYFVAGRQSRHAARQVLVARGRRRGTGRSVWAADTRGDRIQRWPAR